MRVFLTGTTGFVGSHMVRHLLEQGHQVRGLVRKNSDQKLQKLRDSLPDILLPRFEILEGSIGAWNEEMTRSLGTCDAVIHLVGIIREFPSRGITFEKVHVQGTRTMVDAAKTAGVRRFVLMSALGVRPGAVTAYHRTKFAAEEYLRDSGLDWTIFRPSLIIGPGGEFVNMLAGMIRKVVVPMIGDGQKQFQPVAVQNVCEGFVKCLQAPHPVNKVYEVGGPEILTYRQMLDILAKVMNRPIVKVPQSVFILQTMAALFQRFPFFPLTQDQITMFLEGSVCNDADRFYKDLNIQPFPFEACLREFV